MISKPISVYDEERARFNKALKEDDKIDTWFGSQRIVARRGAGHVSELRGYNFRPDELLQLIEYVTTAAGDTDGKDKA